MGEKVRRNVLRTMTLLISGSTAGCLEAQHDDAEPAPGLLIDGGEINHTGSNWELSTSLRAMGFAPIHDPVVVAFDGEGTRVYRQPVGDIGGEGNPEVRNVTITCNSFPAIVSVIARESPCDGAEIEILYWVGSEEQKCQDLPNDAEVWDDTAQECDEELPPDRVIEKVSGSTPTSC